MAKNIVFCADGTWDHPLSTTEVSATDSNVYKFYKACAKSADQMTFYDDGLGVDGRRVEKLAGGAFGAGIFQKVKDGYTDIAQVYGRPGFHHWFQPGGLYGAEPGGDDRRLRAADEEFQ